MDLHDVLHLLNAFAIIALAVSIILINLTIRRMR